MRQEVRNRLLMLRKLVTTQTRASAVDRRRWIAIIPQKDGRILLFEFEHLATADPDSYFAPEEILDPVKTYYCSVDDALATLEERGIDTDRFDAPWKMDYPL